MSARPFARLGRNGVALLLSLLVRDGRTATGRALARASRAVMYPPDRRWMDVEHAAQRRATR